jgi:4-hydroxy-L-threonine phosphate dehydrogenase PdxA
VLRFHSRKLKIALPKQLQIIDIDNVPEPYFGPKPEVSGRVSIEYLDCAFEAYKNGKIDALVTGPIQKESWKLV